MDNPKLVQAEWEKFSAAVMPKEASSVQRREMRRAFFSGAQSILFRVIESLASDAEPTEADMVIMQAIHDELENFASDVAKGKA